MTHAITPEVAFAMAQQSKSEHRDLADNFVILTAPQLTALVQKAYEMGNAVDTLAGNSVFPQPTCDHQFTIFGAGVIRRCIRCKEIEGAAK